MFIPTNSLMRDFDKLKKLPKITRDTFVFELYSLICWPLKNGCNGFEISNDYFFRIDKVFKPLEIQRVAILSFCVFCLNLGKDVKDNTIGINGDGINGDGI